MPRSHYLLASSKLCKTKTKKALDNEGMDIKFEFTARQTPQQNGKVERAFATLYGRMRAMMAAAKWDDNMKHRLLDGSCSYSNQIG